MELKVNFVEPTCNAYMGIGPALRLQFNYELSPELSRAIHSVKGKGFTVIEYKREDSNGKPTFTIKAPAENLIQLTQAIAEHTKVVAKDSYSCPTFSEEVRAV